MMNASIPTPPANSAQPSRPAAESLSAPLTVAGPAVSFAAVSPDHAASTATRCTLSASARDAASRVAVACTVPQHAEAATATMQQIGKNDVGDFKGRALASWTPDRAARMCLRACAVRQLEWSLRSSAWRNRLGVAVRATRSLRRRTAQRPGLQPVARALDPSGSRPMLASSATSARAHDRASITPSIETRSSVIGLARKYCSSHPSRASMTANSSMVVIAKLAPQSCRVCRLASACANRTQRTEADHKHRQRRRQRHSGGRGGDQRARIRARAGQHATNLKLIGAGDEW